MKFYLKTNSPNLFEDTYWGRLNTDKLTLDEAKQMEVIFRNRDKFAEQFHIVKHDDGQSSFSMKRNGETQAQEEVSFMIADHQEQYITSDGKRVIILSPYENTYNSPSERLSRDAILNLHGFKELGVRLYHPTAVTLVKVEEMKTKNCTNNVA